MNRWDERYSQNGYAYGTEPNQFLVEQVTALNLAAPLNILSLGEGEGRNAVYLATLGHHVHAVDGSSVGMAKAHKLAEQNRVSLQTQVADLTHYTINSPCDAVIMIFCHLPSAVRHAIHQKIMDALVPGGVLIYQAYSTRQLNYQTGGPREADLLVNLDELEQCFSNMNVLHGCMSEKEIYEGKYHTGLAAVTEFVARKPFE